MALPNWFAHLVARPGVSRVALTIATVIDRPLMRASGGRLRLSFVIPVLLLRCRGARSGARREVPLLYIPDGEDALLVASNGGRAREPAWAHNLRAHPDVHALKSDGEGAYRAEELEGQERAAAWARALEVYPGYGTYAARVTRTIAVFRLRRTNDRVRPQSAARASSTATAGSVLPSTNSRKAPPPVEM